MNNKELLQYITKEIDRNHDVDVNYTLKGKSYLVKFMSANIFRKINMPCVMVIPYENCSDMLVLESNNLESNDLEKSLGQANETAFELIKLTDYKPAPILVPIIPSEMDLPYFQQLSKESFALSKDDKNYRIDEQIVAMIEQAKKFVKMENGTKLQNKIFLNGYSSSGVFAQRFALLHPELIDTACIGGASGSIPLPSKNIGYPIGIQDYEELFDKSFDMEEYSKIKFRYYVAGLEISDKAKDRFDENEIPVSEHDMSYFERSVPLDVGIKQRSVLGMELFERAEKTVKLLKNSGLNIEHTIIPGREHSNKNGLGLTSLGDAFVDTTYKNSINTKEKEVPDAR